MARKGPTMVAAALILLGAAAAAPASATHGPNTEHGQSKLLQLQVVETVVDREGCSNEVPTSLIFFCDGLVSAGTNDNGDRVESHTELQLRQGPPGPSIDRAAVAGITTTQTQRTFSPSKIDAIRVKLEGCARVSSTIENVPDRYTSRRVRVLLLTGDKSLPVFDENFDVNAWPMQDCGALNPVLNNLREMLREEPSNAKVRIRVEDTWLIDAPQGSTDVFVDLHAISISSIELLGGTFE